MANKNSNVPYDQIPHIVINHPETNSEHWAIMIMLFKVLKDKPKPIIYSNVALSKNCRIALRTVERRISDLVKMGFINCTGLGRSRRISLGLLFNNTASVAVEIKSPPANLKSPPAKNDISARHGGGDNKTYTNPSSKEELSFSSLTHLETRELEICIERNYPLSAEYKYLQSLLDKALNQSLQPNDF